MAQLIAEPADAATDVSTTGLLQAEDCHGLLLLFPESDREDGVPPKVRSRSEPASETFGAL